MVRKMARKMCHLLPQAHFLVHFPGHFMGLFSSSSSSHSPCVMAGVILNHIITERKVVFETPFFVVIICDILPRV